ncbi:MAG: hypothetical protein WC781_05605 [Candidatus Pacearchaeota archaeon]|jgi:hypothetical protein
MTTKSEIEKGCGKVIYGKVKELNEKPFECNCGGIFQGIKVLCPDCSEKLFIYNLGCKETAEEVEKVKDEYLKRFGIETNSRDKVWREFVEQKIKEINEELKAKIKNTLNSVRKGWYKSPSKMRTIELLKNLLAENQEEVCEYPNIKDYPDEDPNDFCNDCGTMLIYPESDKMFICPKCYFVPKKAEENKGEMGK